MLSTSSRRPDLPPRGVRDLHVTPGPLSARASTPPRGARDRHVPHYRWRTYIYVRPWPAGHMECRHATPGRRYTLQRRPRRLLGLSGRRRDLNKAEDDAQDDCHARRHAPQCTSHSARPLHPPRFREKTMTSTIPCACTLSLLVSIKGGGGLPLRGSRSAHSVGHNVSHY